MKNERLDEIQKLIKSKIPITQSLDFSLESWDGTKIILEAPYEKNKNHHDTVFGGSLAMSAIVSGYCMTFMALEDSLGKTWSDDHTLVIKDFSCRYLRPVNNNVRTTSKSMDDNGINEFVDSLNRKGKGRLKVETLILDTELRLSCEATYVAYRKK
jgi:thioesterase domain-containing protein